MRRPQSAKSPRAEDGLRPQLGECGASRLVVGAVDDEHAVEMIELVLNDARGREPELELESLAGRIDPLDRDGL